MFIGRHDVSVDPKGRIHLPAKIRDALKKSYAPPFIVTISDRCLTAHPAKEWLEKYEVLEREARTPEEGDLLRAITENAEEVPIKNGRILISSRLRKYAGIERNIVIVGRIKKIEIWSADCHEKATAGLLPKDLSKKLRELGF